MKRLQIFRAGKHTASDGTTHEFSEQMLRDAVAAYDPKLSEAPLVIGHPTMDAPAYGWAESLHFAAGAIDAMPHQVEPQFCELVEAGRYKKISACWYMPDAPRNPKPGSLYLKHIGFLGAVPPAVKGLRAVQFSADEQGVIEFSDWADSQNASLWRRMREFIIEKFSRDDADKVLPDYAVQSLEDAARTPAETKPLAFSEHTTPEPTMDPKEIEQLKAENAALKAKEASFAERETKLTMQERANKRAAHVAFAESLIKEGKLLPVHKDGVVAFMSTLDEATGVVEFGEGDKKTSKSGSEWFKSYLTAQPKLVEFGEHAGADADSDVVQFAAPTGFTVSEEQLELHGKALAYRKDHPNVSYPDAVRVVSQG